MNQIQIKDIETERLMLKIPTINEQNKLWSIIKEEKINKYYFPTPDRIFNKYNLLKDKVEDLLTARSIFQEQLNDWNRQEVFYNKKILDIYNEENSQKFTWSIFLKDGTIIGQMTVQPSDYYPNNPEIRDVGWFIDSEFQKKGYAVEAAKAILDFMFNEVEIEQILTSAAIINPGSWRIMEKLGFKFNGNKASTYLDDNNNIIECCHYSVTKQEYMEFNNQKKLKQI